MQIDLSTNNNVEYLIFWNTNTFHLMESVNKWIKNNKNKVIIKSTLSTSTFSRQVTNNELKIAQHDKNLLELIALTRQASAHALELWVRDKV